MDNDAYIVLIYKNLQGEISPSEMEQLNLWLNDNPEHEEIERNLRNDWHLSGNYEPQIILDDIDLDEEYALLEEKIQSEELTSSPSQAKEITLAPKNRLWIRYAAALALLMVASFWIYNSVSNPTIELATTKGETKEVLLADGTKVTLNENSQLTYPTNFKNSHRSVALKGEAFFEVSPNTAAPFKIESNSATTTVLGTSFNLEDYDHSASVAIAVYSGQVRFEDKSKQNSKQLIQGQKALLNKESQEIKTQTISFLNDNAWKTHVLTFNDTPLSSVVSDLQEYYNIDIKINPSIADCSFNSRFDLKQNDAKSILSNIAASFQAELIEQSSSSFQIQAGNCQ